MCNRRVIAGVKYLVNVANGVCHFSKFGLVTVSIHSVDVYYKTYIFNTFNF